MAPIDGQVAAAPLQALRGDAGQRALAAWSMGWEPALAASGDGWEGLYLSVLLADPYPPVRVIASRSLAKLPEFDQFSFDPNAPLHERQDKGNEALEIWADGHARRRTSLKPELLLGYDGPRMELVLRILAQRDDRPVTFAE